jgi:dipeptidyl aminopeptidase/acylaminoacyl peptidase
VYHLATNKAVQLGDQTMPDVDLNTEKQFILGYNNQPYLHQIMYNGFFYDSYSVDTQTGEKNVILTGKRVRPTLSPNGQFAAYFDAGHIQLKSLNNSKVEAITKEVKAMFANDQHDYPSEQPGYGFAGWSSDSQTLYAYSKHDIWAFDVTTLQAQRLTNGYQTNTRYRVRNLDKNTIAFDAADTLLVSAFNLQNKQTGVATLDLSDNTLIHVLSGEAKFDLVSKAKETDTLIYTRQSYHEFPDFWVSNTALKQSTKLTELNPQKEQFLWGGQPELVQYKGFDGEDLQGVLIKPAGYQAGDKVPVVIYFYRYMSQRMYDFPKMELNHRPNFPMFTSNGYAIFLPDIRFEVGHPGKSSTQTMINAAQKLIDMGVADKDKIGLQGHSWAGYQSAFMVTQTDMFKAVVSGAPVSNMTSAYSGIRLNSGLARQFQYETGQSRIGKDLFEAQDLYIENSPVFFADKVNTPIMVMFGDQDGAVPWQEGIQYYLALRRAGKDVIFLQYEGEPHHLKKFPNQVDFSIRMMEYFDHHLKGKPAAKWISSGIPYEQE